MKKTIAKLSMLLVLVCLLASCFSISALAAAPAREGDEGFLGFMSGPYGWIEENLGSVVNYLRVMIPELTEVMALWAVYLAWMIVALVLAVVAVLLIVSIFKGRFFRALARTVLWCTVIWCVSYLQFFIRIVIIEAGVTDFEVICLNFSDGIRVFMPELYELFAKVSVFTSKDLPWLLPIVFLAAQILIIVLCAIIIKSSKKRARRKAAARAAAAVAETEAILAETSETALLEASAETAVEPVAEQASAPEAETAVEETPAEEASAEEASVEEAPAEETSLDEYPVLETPVFMPIPSAIFDTVDFTEPKRDGFVLTTGVAGLDASYGMSDELAEELTAVVYAGAQGGEIVKIGVDCLCANFKPYSYINVKILRRLGLIPESASAIMVTDHGTVDKPLMVEAADFSPSAVKMLTLAGGRAVRLA